MAQSPEELDSFRKKAFTVFGSLLVLTVLTVGLSLIHIGSAESHAGNIAVGLLVATVKAGLVALVFMHLFAERRWVYGVLVLTVVFFIHLVLLPVYTGHDGVSGSEARPFAAASAEKVEQTGDH